MEPSRPKCVLFIWRMCAPRSGCWTSCAGCCWPAGRTAARRQLDPASPALVLFTSGSEGAPKGVVHSHRSLLANCAQLRTVVDFHPSDRVFNALPMFHAFGMIATLLPLMYGVRDFLYPSPLHYRIVPEMVYAEQSTIMFGTDTFLTGYARKGNPLDFQSLRYIFAGGEKVRPETRGAYMTLFKKPIFEGYGVTETAPVLALSTWAHFRRVGRPVAAGHRGPAGTGARHRRRRPAFGARPQRDAGLPARGCARRAAASAGRLVRHRRHRYDRCRGIHNDQGTRQTLRQDRRRNGLPRRGRGTGDPSGRTPSMPSSRYPMPARARNCCWSPPSPAPNRARCSPPPGNAEPRKSRCRVT